MDAREIFLARHASVHSAKMEPDGWWKEEDTIWTDLTEDELRRRPTPDHNTMAWLVWHMARCEDAAVNAVLRGTSEVLDRGGWLPELGITSRHIGTGATFEEVNEISQMICLDALRAYRAAVGRETHAWVEILDFRMLNGTISAVDARCAANKSDFGEHGHGSSTTGLREGGHAANSCFG